MPKKNSAQNTHVFFKISKLTEFSLAELRKLVINVEELATLQQAWLHKKDEWLALHREVYDYFSTMQIKINELTQLQKNHPHHREVNEHLTFYQNESHQAQEQLNKIEQELAVVNRFIIQIEDKIGSKQQAPVNSVTR